MAHTKEANILVIGSGLAGAVAALTAAEENKKVILITGSNTLLSGNTKWAQGGIAYSQKKDSKVTFQEDIYNAGGYHNHESAVEQLVNKGSQLIEQLLIKSLIF